MEVINHQLKIDPPYPSYIDSFIGLVQSVAEKIEKVYNVEFDRIYVQYPMVDLYILHTAFRKLNWRLCISFTFDDIPVMLHQGPERLEKYLTMVIEQEWAHALYKKG